MTGQKNSNATLRMAVQVAPGLRLFNVLIHVLVATLVLLALPVPFQSIVGVSLLVLILLLSGWRIDKQLALRGRKPIRYLQHDAEGWAIGADADSLQAVQLRAGTFVASSFVVLSWQVDAAAARWPWRRRGQLLLTPAMLGPDDYRRLCRQLWQHQNHPK